MKSTKVVILALLFIASAILVFYADVNGCALIGSISAAFCTILFEKAYKAFEDLFDTSDWKKSQTKLLRGGFIRKSTIVRISFAYLYRIKLGNQYLLIKNDRGTGKYQPVGGVYKFFDKERVELQKRYHIIDDDKIPVDDSSRNDYRLKLQCKHLRSFIRRFNSKKSSRERIENLGREFSEEMIQSGLLSWKRISYRYCGRDITELHFSDFFQCYEILLADIVELIPDETQTNDLKDKCHEPNDSYRFATSDEILHLGVTPCSDSLAETIADHSLKILQENDSNLIKAKGINNVFTALL